jgi:hypothetical protein
MLNDGCCIKHHQRLHCLVWGGLKHTHVSLCLRQRLGCKMALGTSAQLLSFDTKQAVRMRAGKAPMNMSAHPRAPAYKLLLGGCWLNVAHLFCLLNGASGLLLAAV